MAFRDSQGVNASGSIFNDVGGDQNYYLTFVADRAFGHREDEPRNYLTTFTRGEWVALDELRENIPGILAEAYVNQRDPRKTPINLWGVTIDPKDLGDARVSALLMRFLRAQKLDVRKTQEILAAFLRWREEYNVKGVTDEQFPEEVFGNLVHFYGRDGLGRPVVYILWGANSSFSAIFDDFPRFLRWQVSIYEKVMHLVDFETADQIILVSDEHNVSFFSTLSTLKSLKPSTEAFSVYSAIMTYQRFVACEYIVNNSNWTSFIYNTASTLGKILYSGVHRRVALGSNPDEVKKGLLNAIGPSQLPRRYGGDAIGF